MSESLSPAVSLNGPDFLSRVGRVARAVEQEGLHPDAAFVAFQLEFGPSSVTRRKAIIGAIGNQEFVITTPDGSRRTVVCCDGGGIVEQVPSRFRPVYRACALTDEERALHDKIMAKAAELETLFNRTQPGRYQSLALTDLESAVSWAIKGLNA